MCVTFFYLSILEEKLPPFYSFLICYNDSYTMIHTEKSYKYSQYMMQS